LCRVASAPDRSRDPTSSHFCKAYRFLRLNCEFHLYNFYG
jgi:hypothetical protein